MWRARAALGLGLVVAMLSPTAALGGSVEDAVAATQFTPDGFLAAFDHAVLPGLAPVGPAPAITGSATLDARIRAIGEQRGYRRRPSPARPLVAVDGVPLQPEAAAGWASLRAAAAAAGHLISVRSGFRGHSMQASFLRRELPGTSDAAIDRGLRIAAPPGYSKHHTGYAIDIRASDGGGHALRYTAAYAWLSADNFANAKADGWIPSYPDGSGPAGPDAEPWELVWVGADNLLCAGFAPSPDQPFCDTVGSTFEADIRWFYEREVTTGCGAHRFCSHSPATRGELATMLWRLAGRPVSSVELPFADVERGRYHYDAIRWLFELGITTGTTPATFEPDRRLTRAELVTLLWRMAGSPHATNRHPFVDVAPDSFASPAVSWAAATGVTRGTSSIQFTPHGEATRGQGAAFLHRFDSLV